MNKGLFFILFILFICCAERQNKTLVFNVPKEPYVVVLGTAQDAGYPQVACEKECCKRVQQNPELKEYVSAIAVVDPISNESWIFDATPDFTAQTKLLSHHLKNKELPDGIFLTHGHIGHYTGLMFLGREALGADKMPVYAMPKMNTFLTENGPWSQLVELNNIQLTAIKKDSTILLNERISVKPIQVPHRDEFTETVGYMINNQQKKALFIPDIDKWQKWDRSIVDYIKNVDLAFLDATFFKDGEINRDMNEVPHPFVQESVALFENLTAKEKQKIYFIHFNHTNPLLIKGSEAQKTVLKKGFNIAEQGMVVRF